LALALIYARYFGVLGAGSEPTGSLDRQGYDALRQNVATGGLAVGLYSHWLTIALDAVDRFFGDTDKAGRTLFPRAFGLRTPAPLWTAPAFDRCLLLALFYPIVTVFIMWAVSGHVGPAENVLRLPRDLSVWMRGVAVAALVSGAFGFWRTAHTSGWISGVWAAVAIAATFLLFLGASYVGAFTFAFAVCGAVVVFLALAITGAVALARGRGGAAVLAGGGAMVLAGAGAGAGAVTVTGAVALVLALVTVSERVFGDASPVFIVPLTFAIIVAIVWRSRAAIRNRRHGVFLAIAHYPAAL
jgi:hypothetical protein